MIEVKIEIVGLSDLTETLNLLASVMATQKDMPKTLEVLSERKPYRRDAEATDVVEEPEGEIRRPEVVADVKEILGEEVEELDSQVAMDEPTVTLDEIRAYIVAKAKADKTTKAKAKAILDKYEADNISSLKPEHFEAVYKELEAM